MTDLRKLAKGQPCMIRIPGCCNHNPETTVLAHYRMAGLCGTGQKPPDECGAWACSSCHDLVDGRNPGKDLPPHIMCNLDRLHLQGIMRTLNELRKLGYGMKK